jgi:beta-fructofuranosidase
MHWSIAVLSYVLGSALAQNSGYNATEPSLGPDVLTADMISGMGNNTLFNRWRPTYHFISPAGWMNVSISKHPKVLKLIYSGPMRYDV